MRIAEVRPRDVLHTLNAGRGSEPSGQWPGLTRNISKHSRIDFTGCLFFFSPIAAFHDRKGWVCWGRKCRKREECFSIVSSSVRMCHWCPMSPPSHHLTISPHTQQKSSNTREKQGVAFWCLLLRVLIPMSLQSQPGLPQRLKESRRAWKLRNQNKTLL